MSSDDTSIAIIASSMLFVYIVVVIAFAWYYFSKKRTKNNKSDTGLSPSDTGGLLPLPNVSSKDSSPWNISWVNNPERFSTKNNELELKFVKNEHGSGSGAAFRANPWKKFPTDQVTFAYDVYFPPSFQWVKGGKLPGVCFGPSGASGSNACATGGEWGDNEGSFRIMFRENGTAIGYAYLAIKGGSSAAYAKQNASYKSIVKKTGGAGHDLWKVQKVFTFKRGQWNAVSFSIKLNDPAKSNGTLRLTINGVTRELQDVIWRENASVKFSNIIFVSFFGGGSNDWNSPVNTSIKFRNIKFSAQ